MIKLNVNENNKIVYSCEVMNVNDGELKIIMVDVLNDLYENNDEEITFEDCDDVNDLMCGFGMDDDGCWNVVCICEK